MAERFLHDLWPDCSGSDYPEENTEKKPQCFRTISSIKGNLFFRRITTTCFTGGHDSFYGAEKTLKVSRINWGSGDILSNKSSGRGSNTRPAVFVFSVS